MVERLYRVTCDWCGNSFYFSEKTRTEALKAYVSLGGVRCSRFHFCNDNCLKSHFLYRGKAMLQVKGNIIEVN